ncbi:NfeD family protein [Streptomyces sp. NPDC056244]|uniref:NfeD family protein n=1 Tax=unclassified Streptomyces TaxID=2593676 RepID=UPI0035DBAE6E
MTVFLGLGIAGIVLLVLSLIFDGILEGLFGGISLLNGLFDGLLSLPVIAGFVSMLGFTAAIVEGSTDLGTAPAVVAGAAAGAGAAWLTWKFSKALMRDDQTVATPRGDDLVGTAGTVVTAIPAAGYGEVLLRLGGQTVKYAAKGEEPVEQGAEIWVEATLSSTSVSVRRVQR